MEQKLENKLLILLPQPLQKLVSDYLFHRRGDIFKELLLSLFVHKNISFLEMDFFNLKLCNETSKKSFDFATSTIKIFYHSREVPGKIEIIYINMLALSTLFIPDVNVINYSIKRLPKKSKMYIEDAIRQIQTIASLAKQGITDFKIASCGQTASWDHITEQTLRESVHQLLDALKDRGKINNEDHRILLGLEKEQPRSPANLGFFGQRWDQDMDQDMNHAFLQTACAIS
jgi:hypothetical protein